MRTMRHAKGIIITRAIICCYIAASRGSLAASNNVVKSSMLNTIHFHLFLALSCLNYKWLLIKANFPLLETFNRCCERNVLKLYCLSLIFVVRAHTCCCWRPATMMFSAE